MFCYIACGLRFRSSCKFPSRRGFCKRSIVACNLGVVLSSKFASVSHIHLSNLLMYLL